MILVTSLCWCLYDGDLFQMLVAESLCWRLFSLCWWFSQCIKSVINIFNQSPASQTCHQYIWSPTSVTNIDVTKLNLVWNDLVSLLKFLLWKAIQSMMFWVNHSCFCSIIFITILVQSWICELSCCTLLIIWFILNSIRTLTLQNRYLFYMGHRGFLIRKIFESSLGTGISQ